jgi:hypothetical protein
VSIYQRLFKYRERASRAPHEDFLSEALVDLLNRIPTQEVLPAISRLFIRSAEHRIRWETYLKSNPTMKLSWDTQKTIVFENNSARLDIVLHDDGGNVLIVIENKN